MDDSRLEALLHSDSSALLSDDRRFRFALWRRWSPGPLVAFVGLNPSTADETENDPTIRRCVEFAKRWGYGGLCMLNVFSFRSTDPKGLRSAPADPPENLEVIRWCAQRVELIVLAWGNHGAAGAHRVLEALEGFPRFRTFAHLRTFGLTKEGQPKHPLYLRSDASLVRLRQR